MTQQSIGSNVPLRLADALAIAFPMGGMTVAGLRRERDKGNLVVIRIAGKEFVTLAAIDACRLAGDIAPRAAQLAAATPKLRAKGAGEVIKLLLNEDAVPGTLQTASLTRWGARRLFERLTALGTVRELSGRASFRLYGL